MLDQREQWKHVRLTTCNLAPLTGLPQGVRLSAPSKLCFGLHPGREHLSRQHCCSTENDVAASASRAGRLQPTCGRQPVLPLLWLAHLLQSQPSLQQLASLVCCPSQRLTSGEVSGFLFPGTLASIVHSMCTPTWHIPTLRCVALFLSRYIR